MGWAGERAGARSRTMPSCGSGRCRRSRTFWAAVWEFCGVRASRPYEQVLDRSRMPGARWFAGAEFNYAENMPGARWFEGARLNYAENR